MNKEDFKREFEPIRDILEKQGIDVNADDYDGVVVKRLSGTNTRGYGESQTHIEFTGKQMDMFPYLASYAYFEDFSNEGDMKSFYVFEMPIFLDVLNLQYLLENHGEYDRSYMGENDWVKFNDCVSFLKKTLASEENKNKAKIDTYSTLLRGIKEDSIHTEISQINTDDKNFQGFRWLLPIYSYIVILKLRKEVKYEIYGFLPNDVDLIENLNSKFYYYHNTKDEKTLVPLEHFEIPGGDNDGGIDDDFKAENLLLYGVPGVGKSWTIKNVKCENVDEYHMERVVFHPDYTYSDFVGQILPKVLDNDDIKYEFAPGPFTCILRKAHKYPSEMFYLIIEEINRGNAPAIFGDVFQLLDRMKEDDEEKGLRKGESEFGITNSEVAKVVYGEEEKNRKVRIPHNVSIIATMNTSDQNVFSLDTAFKRRWHMEMIKNDFNEPNFKDKTIHKNSDITWQVFGEAINEVILEMANSTLSSEDKRLGAFFVDEEDFNSPRQFGEKVLMYLWDDVFKFDREKYFNKGKVNPFSLEILIEEFEKTEKEEKFTIFTNTIDNKIDEVKKRLMKGKNGTQEEVEEDLEKDSYKRLLEHKEEDEEDLEIEENESEE